MATCLSIESPLSGRQPGLPLLLLLHHPGVIHHRWDRGYCLVEGEGDLCSHLPGFLTLVVLLRAVFLCLASLGLLHFAPVLLSPIIVLDQGS